MKEFFKYLQYDAKLAVFFAIAVGGFAFLLADRAFVPAWEEQGVVIEKEIIPPHTTSHMHRVGKATMPMSVRHPQRYQVAVMVAGTQTYVADTGEELFRGLNVGDMVLISVAGGRFSGVSEVKGLRKF